MIERDHRAVFSEQLRQRRRGRPRCAAPKVRLSVRVPQDVFDSLCGLASERRAPLHAFVEQALTSRARDPRV
jgi:hypothetical protein